MIGLSQRDRPECSLWTFSTAVTFKYEDSPVHFAQFINTEIIIENELKKRAGRERESFAFKSLQGIN